MSNMDSPSSVKSAGAKAQSFSNGFTLIHLRACLIVYYLLVLTEKEGNILYRDDIVILFPYSLFQLEMLNGLSETLNPIQHIPLFPTNPPWTVSQAGFRV